MIFRDISEGQKSSMTLQNRPASLQRPIARNVTIVMSIHAIVDTTPNSASAIHHCKSHNVAEFQHVSFAHRLPWRRVLRVGIESTDCLEFATGEKEMKKLLLIGFVLSLSTGCGRGWLPCLNRGAACGNAGCIGAPPALPQGCNACVGGSSAGYGSYEGDSTGGYYGNETIVGDSYSGGGQIVPGAIYGSGAISSPSMQNLPSPVQPAP
jgi:hypothetical protein